MADFDLDMLHDDIFAGSPREKYFEILLNASPTLVSAHIEAIVKQNIVAKHLLEKYTGRDMGEVEQDIANHAVSARHVEEDLDSFYIGHMSSLLSSDG